MSGATYGGASIDVEKIGDGVLITIRMKADGTSRVIHFPDGHEAYLFGREVMCVAMSEADSIEGDLAALTDPEGGS